MMPAAKHGDPQMGVDIHLCVVPPSPSPVPLPTPHTSIVFDPFDYVPFIGATVTVCGMRRAVAGTAGTAIHIPPGFPFAPKLPDKDDEIFMGSATVEADGDPFSFLAVPVLSCQVAGMASPPRTKRKGGPRVCVLPLTFNMAIPTNVFVGGPPTISLMGMAFKAGFAALGKLAKSKFAKAVGDRFRDWRKAKFGHLNPGFLKCTILRAEPVNIVTGAVSVEQEDFTLPGLIPVRWTRRYASDNPRRGALGTGWDCPADARLEQDAETGVVLFHHPEGGIAIFRGMPAAEGDAAAVLELMDGALLSDHGAEYRVRTKEDRIYRFPKAFGLDVGGGNREFPLWQIRDLCGNTLTWDRDHASGRALALVESAGRRIELTHGPGGLIQGVSLHVPESGFRHTWVTYEQDAAGDLTAAIDALGHPYRFFYDRHRMVRHTDRNGLSFHYAYDAEHRVVRSWGDGGLYAYKFAYLDKVRERKITDSLGHVSVVTLDERGLPVREIDALGGITIYEYDEAGRTTAVVDQDGHRTEYAFDERGNLTQLTRPDGAVSKVGYMRDKPAVVTDENGQIWQQHWDERGLLLEKVSPLGHRTRYEYDERGQLIGHIDARGVKTTLNLDRHGNVVAITDRLGRTERFTTDPRGRTTSRVDHDGRKILLQYDVMGRLAAARLPGGRQVRCAYDNEGHLSRFVDASGHETRFAYSGLGQVASRHQADGHTVEYAYDTEERLVGVRNQRGEVHTLRRDALGRLVEEVDYWGQRRRYELTPGGRVSTTLDPLGRKVAFDTDALGRVVRKRAISDDDPDRSSNETFRYDPVGNLVEMTNASVTVRRTLDAEGRLTREEQTSCTGDTFWVENAYDPAGNRIMRRTSNGTEIGYGFDAMDRMAAVLLDGKQELSVTRKVAGTVVEHWLRSGIAHERRFDMDDLLVGQRMSTERRQLFATAYTYDAARNLVEREDTEFGTDRFEYDSVGRVTSHLRSSGAPATYTNDPAGDRLKTRISGNRTGPGGREPAIREGRLGQAIYRFDAVGNLVLKRSEESLLELSWDANRRLVRSARNDVATTYGYDPLGRRIFKETNGRRTWFGWDGDTLAASHDGDEVCEYLYRPDSFEPLAIKRRDARGESLLISYNDPNGCPQRLVDRSGIQHWSARFAAWGEASIHVDRVQNPVRFQGQYFDTETGMAYNRYRYFDYQAGQFISADPLSIFAGPNTYEMAPNLIGWADPLGLTCGKITGDAGVLRRKLLAARAGDASAAAELRVAKMLRDEGKHVHFIDDLTSPLGTFDFLVDGVRTDTKRVNGLGHAAKDIAKGVRQVGPNGEVIVVRPNTAAQTLESYQDFANKFTPIQPGVTRRVVDEDSLPPL